MVHYSSYQDDDDDFSRRCVLFFLPTRKDLRLAVTPSCSARSIFHVFITLYEKLVGSTVDLHALQALSKSSHEHHKHILAVVMVITLVS